MVPTVEPSSLTIGDSWTWSKTFDDYPADDGWTLTYRLIPTTGTVITITATDDDGDHLVDVAAATTATYSSGSYAIVGSVSDGTDRFEVYRSRITLNPNPASGAYEYRTFWEQIRDQCEDALSEASGRKEVSYSINGHSHTLKSHDEILELLSYANAMVHNEESEGRNRKILIRFR